MGSILDPSLHSVLTAHSLVLLGDANLKDPTLAFSRS